MGKREFLFILKFKIEAGSLHASPSNQGYSFKNSPVNSTDKLFTFHPVYISHNSINLNRTPRAIVLVVSNEPVGPNRIKRTRRTLHVAHTSHSFERDTFRENRRSAIARSLPSPPPSAFIFVVSVSLIHGSRRRVNTRHNIKARVNDLS